MGLRPVSPNQRKTMTIETFDQLLSAAQAKAPRHMAITVAQDPKVLISVEEAQRQGIATATLIGDAPAIKGIAAAEGLSLDGADIVHETEQTLAARRAVALAREGRADVIVKGQIKTADLLHEVLDRHTGVRDKKLLTHVGLFEIPGYDRLLYLSDSGVVMYPTIWQKLEIIRNAVDVAHVLGLEEPKVAVIAAFEIAHPKSTASIDALALARMAQEGWVKGAIVDGPLALDIAISAESARIKQVKTPIAGNADILIVSSVPTGNITAKGMMYFGSARMAGAVVGAQVPIIINSRADTAETRLLSMALAAVLAARK
jgi:phosphate butyryltransferase